MVAVTKTKGNVKHITYIKFEKAENKRHINVKIVTVK